MNINKFLNINEFFQGVNWGFASFLLVNAALGAGVLNYPVAYDRIGGITSATFIQLVLTS